MVVVVVPLAYCELVVPKFGFCGKAVHGDYTAMFLTHSVENTSY
jgi:hypothetical protein